MGLEEKILSAKSTNWVIEGFDEAEAKTIVELAKISARIEMYRIEKGMTQKEFAKYMGVTQGMVSKWESRDYNFTIRSLNEICEKIGMNFSTSMQDKNMKVYFKPVPWVSEQVEKKAVQGNDGILDWKHKGAIA